MRAKNPTPNAVQALNALKIITLSQYLPKVGSSSYQHDEGTFLAGLTELKAARTIKRNSDKGFEDNVGDEFDALFFHVNKELDFADLNALIYFGGYVLHKTFRKFTCRLCKSFFIGEGGNKTNLLTELKEFRSGALCKCTEKAVLIFQIAEETFNCAYNQSQHFTMLKNIHSKLTKLILKNVNKKLIDVVPQCDNTMFNIISRFVKARIYFQCRFNSGKLKESQNS
jgi:hypothetical protein